MQVGIPKKILLVVFLNRIFYNKHKAQGTGIGLLYVRRDNNKTYEWELLVENSTYSIMTKLYRSIVYNKNSID